MWAAVTAVLVAHYGGRLLAGTRRGRTERARAPSRAQAAAGADQTADLVREGVHGGGALVMDRRKCVGRLGGNADRQPAAHGVVDDEHRDVGAVLDAQRSRGSRSN